MPSDQSSENRFRPGQLQRTCTPPIRCFYWPTLSARNLEESAPACAHRPSVSAHLRGMAECEHARMHNIHVWGPVARAHPPWLSATGAKTPVRRGSCTCAHADQEVAPSKATPGSAPQHADCRISDASNSRPRRSEFFYCCFRKIQGPPPSFLIEETQMK